MGRAPEALVMESNCCGAVARLQSRLPESSGRVKLAGTANTWSWTVECDGELLAVSGRAYLRQRECQYSLWQFLAAAEVATVVAAERGPHLCAQ
ncbi:hypothetical protein [Catenulispora yoronensis]|uniref:hypothetical protein n=1 Tax=Catenulispora yoronensis TaxID=450799 RepID=UPI0031D02416